MPTLLQIQVPVDSQPGNNESADDLDETTLGASNNDTTLNQESDDSKDETMLNDKSLDLLMDDSIESSRTETDFNASKCSHKSPKSRTDLPILDISQKELKERDFVDESDKRNDLFFSMATSANDETRLSETNSSCSTPPKQRSSQKPKVAFKETHQVSSELCDEKNQENPPQRSRTSNTCYEWSQFQESNRFRMKLKEKISDFENRNPQVKLCEYNSLTPEEKRLEQERLIVLLDRLGIRKRRTSGSNCSQNAPVDNNLPEDASVTRLESSNSFQSMAEASGFGNQRPDSSISSVESTLSSPTEQRYSGAVKRSSTPPFSAGLLSPVIGESPKHMSLRGNPSPKFLADSPVCNNDDSSVAFPACADSLSEQSVEVTRRADEPSFHLSPMYKSPAIQMMSRSKVSKRLASTSGKRGNDKVRTKLNQDSSSDSDDDESMPPVSQPWPSSDDSLSLLSDVEQQERPFIASQSPISESSRIRGSRSHQLSKQKQQSQTTYRENSQSQHRSKAEGYYYGHQGDDTVDIFDATFTENHQGRSRLREVSTNVSLKNGVPFHYNPLHIKRSKRTNRKERARRDGPLHRTVDFRDPLEAYLGQGKELYQIFEWIYDRDSDHCEKWSTAGKGIIFSLKTEQIVNVTIKLLMEIDMQSDYGGDKFSCDTSLSAQTLIVVRSKEDIIYWERALREQTPFSVISYPDMPYSERKRSATAAKCATYDIVISTFDALKAPDITVQLDDDGHAVARSNAESQSNGGWMTKRSSNSASSSQRLGSSQPVDAAVKCKQLSSLHRAHWRRVIFVDDLGRKSFVAKLGTARSSAAIALNGNSRFIFFSEIEGTEESAFESLIRSDKRAIQSVASVLRIDIDNDDDDLLGVILDPAQGM